MSNPATGGPGRGGRGIVLVAALLLPACHLVTNDELAWKRELAFSATLQLPLPSPITAGVPFTVHVLTAGGSTNCSRRGAAEVRYLEGGTVAEVTPRDDVATGDRTCTAMPAVFTHQVALRFDTPGTRVIRLRGVGGFERAVPGVTDHPVTVLASGAVAPAGVAAR